MIEPRTEDIGRKVVYRDMGGRGKLEEGVITSFSEFYVFVRYGANTTSAPTNRKDLEWSHRTAEQTSISTTIQNPLPPS